MSAIAEKIIDWVSVFWLPKFSVIVDVLRPFWLDKDGEGAKFFEYRNTVNSIIGEFFADYHANHRHDYMVKDGDSIDVNRMIKVVSEVVKAFKKIEYFENLGTMNKNYWERNGVKYVESKDQESNVFASGVLTEDYEDCDPDPYLTAGGYRGWKATKGTLVLYTLNSLNRVVVKFRSNCMVDHYNNNFFGNSTGGGTTKYEIGERVETRTYDFGYDEFMDTSINKGLPYTEKFKFHAKVTYVDCDKALRLANKNLGIE